eukprot:6553559-Prorocentrum_lima.AAC.1
MAHRVNRDDKGMLIPWAIPTKENSDAPKEIIGSIDMITVVGPVCEDLLESKLSGCNQAREESSSMNS